MEKPTINYAVAYQRFRSDLNGYIVQLQKKYPLPNYMVEGILSSLLSDVRSAVVAEAVSEEQEYLRAIEAYYGAREAKLNDEITEMKAKDKTE